MARPMICRNFYGSFKLAIEHVLEPKIPDKFLWDLPITR